MYREYLSDRGWWSRLEREFMIAESFMANSPDMNTISYLTVIYFFTSIATQT